MSDSFSATRARSRERLLAAAVLALLVVVWLEPAGSWLAEPDEARYAEIPREMLASGDFVTPRLNGVPYFEKPPLLYWANAASFALLGVGSFSARLPTRLAATATALLLALAVGRLRSRREGLAAALLYLAAPLPFVSARLNATDGLLTLFFAATLLASLAALRRASDGRPMAALAAAAGALAAGGFLTKGLVAVVLPGGILLLWAVVAKRAAALGRLLLSPAPVVFVALAAPWPALAERAHPGFLQFFFIHEHFQRFATPAASRPGPIYYFAALFLAGFLPALPFFFPGARAAARRDPVGLFFLIWFAVVLVFFSLSRSKLPPYLFPALPAAAALSSRGFALRGGSRRPWLVHAALVLLFLAACAAVPDVRRAIAANGLGVTALVGSAAVVAGAAGALAARTAEGAASAAGFGWAGLYAALVFAWPRLSLATDVHLLAETARTAAARADARTVSYRTYLQGFPWELRSVVPLADHRGELEDWWLRPDERREIFWTDERFREEWTRGPLVVLTRTRELERLAGKVPSPRVLAIRGKYCVVSNR